MSLSQALLHIPNAVNFDKVKLQPSEVYQYVLLNLLYEGGQSRVWFAVLRGQPDHRVVIKQYDLNPSRTETERHQHLISSPASLQTEEYKAKIMRFKYETSLYQIIFERSRKQQTTRYSNMNCVPLLKSFIDPVDQFGYMIFPYIDVPANPQNFVCALSNSELYHAILQLAQCLQQFHELGIIHGDVKPRNVLWNRLTKEPWVTDLGSAQLYLPGIIMDGKIGTIPYLPPELSIESYKYTDKAKIVHRRIDCWCIGVTFICWIAPHIHRITQGNDRSVVSSFFQTKVQQRRLGKHKRKVVSLVPQFKNWGDWFTYYFKELSNNDANNFKDRYDLLVLLDPMLQHVCHPNPRKRWEMREVVSFLVDKKNQVCVSQKDL